MMYRNSQKVHLNAADTRLQRRVLLIACAVLLIATIALSVSTASNGAYRGRAEAAAPSMRWLSWASARPR